MAIAGFVLSIVSVPLCFCGITGLLGFIFGMIGRKQIRESGNTQAGSGLAKAAIIIGGIITVLWIVWMIALSIDSDHCISVGSGDYCRPLR